MLYNILDSFKKMESHNGLRFPEFLFFFYRAYRYRSVEQDWGRAEEDIWA